MTLLREQLGTFASEILIEFHEDGTLADVLEFFVYREGLPAATLAEISEWLATSMADVVQRRRRG